MNKFITLCLLLCGFCYVTNAQPFYLRGSHGAPCDWSNTNASCELTDPDNDGVYSLNFTAPFSGVQEFKVYDDGTGIWYGPPSGSNAWYVTNAGQSILISFDSNTNQIQVSGDLVNQSNICAPGDWIVPNWNNATPTNNGCIDVPNPGNYQYKPTYCGTWASWSPIDGTRDMNSSNWQLNTLVVNQTECFVYDATTGHVAPPPPPQGFYVRGSFACDWNNLNTGCQLEDDGFGNYSVTVDLGPTALGCQEFKIYDASNNLWYPSASNAWFDHQGGEVTFYLDNNNLVGVKDHANFSICAPGNYTEPMWNNSTPMYSVGGNIWCFTVPVAGAYEWKPTYCGDWKSWEPGTGEPSVGSENWTIETECDFQNVCVRYNPNTGRMEEAFTSSESSGTMACNDHVTVTLNDQCEADIPFSMFVESDSQIPPPAYSVQITNSVGVVVTSPSDYIGAVLTYEVMDNCSGNTCWGTVTFEDKTPPTVECDCPVGGETGIGDYSEDCTLTCWELPILKEKYWDRLRDGLVPEMFDDFVDDNTFDNCNAVTEDDISFYDVYIDLGPCEGTLLRRTWVVSYDNAGGSGEVSCTREYFFKPVGIETLDTARLDPNTGAIVIPEDSLVLPFHLVELTCGADISPAGIAAYFDNPGTEDQDTDDDRLDPQELDIDVVIENNEGIPFAYPHYWVEGRNPSGPHAQPIDTEVCSIIVGYTDQEIEACAPGCDGNRKVLRNWTILDWCTGEFVEYGQIIKSIDQGNPSLVVNDVTASVDPWKCSADVSLPHPEHIYDDCDSDLSYYIGYVEGGLTVTGNAEDGYILHDVPNGETISVEYYTADCCGNRGNAYIDVTVSDLTPPVPVTKQYIVLSLTNIANPVDENQGIAKLYAEDVDNGSYDGCTDVEFAVRRVGEVCPGEDTTWGDFVKFCCEDLDGATAVEIDVHFRVTDEYGNVNYAWATVLLEDKSGTNQTCPPDMVLTCDMDYNDFTMTGLPRLFSACGEIDLDCDPNELIEDTEPRRKGPNDGNFAGTPYDGVEVPAYDPSCGFGAIRRQFRSCSSCTQWFVIEPIDAFDASTISFPDNQVVDCDGFDTGEPDWEPATCNLVGVTVSSDTFRFEDGACYKILNHWSIINWCEYDPTNPSAGGRYDHTQEIKIIDTQDPVLTVADSLCFAVNVDCVSEGVQMSASGNDEGDCGSEWLKWEVIIDLNSDWTNDMYFGTDLPRLVNGVPNPYYIAPTGNDELATITLPDGLSSSKIWHRSVWRLYDGCGNNVSAVRYFQITDKKAPTPYCLNISTAVMSGNGEVELWAIDFNVGSFDNCTDSDNLLFTFTDVAPPARDDSEYDSSSDLEWYNGTFWYYDSETGDYQDQDDYGDEVHRWEPGLRSAGKIFTIDDVDASGFAQIPIYVWDECGNTDYCLVNLRIIDNMGVGEGRIAGQIMTESGDEVEGVMTELMSEAPEYPAYNMTNSNGEYAFNSVAHLNDYEITGTKNDDYLNGVSTLDLLLMQRHILGQEQLDSPYKMIAADVNDDKEISALDLIELRKLILGVYSALPNNGSWKIIDGSQSLNTVNPWIYSEYLRINNLEEDMMHEDFVGVKIGDVNGSVQANTRTVTETSNRGVLTLTYNDATVKTGDLVELSLTTTEAEVYGYQFTMGMSGMELVEVSGEGLSEGNVGVFADRMTISYNSVEAMNTNESVMTVVMRATQDGQLSELVNINSDITKAEAYVGKGLEVVNIDMGQEEVEGAFALYQNQPNPFTESTVIGFDLPKSTEVTMSFYDVTGRVLRVIERDGQKGYNEVRVDKEDLGANGMIYYKLETKTHTATQHMMMIE